ncbi:MAG: alcohol dehydrogenase [Chloroflexi bacterium HGW-Chloroflexi-3]|nr:MAG: alcohol dehydrogenase [Chloroflexi bacterium HGW-Chloroflexi-3]
MKYKRYQSLDYEIPQASWAWNMYGAGLENFGKGLQPELEPIIKPDADQLLVRIDSVGLCFSDLKVVRLGGAHPKLYNRDLQVEPARLGHEVSLTIIQVGENLKGHYHAGQRLAMQPDIYQQGKSTAYGYTIPGGLIQYHLIGKEVLETDEGECLLPVDDTPLSYGAASLLEPWGCVMAAYTQRRRLWPLQGGVMWLVGSPGDEHDYLFSKGLDSPVVIVCSNIPTALLQQVKQSKARVIEKNDLTLDTYAAFCQEVTAGKGYDDIILLQPARAIEVESIAKLIARRGILNMMGEKPLDDLVQIDMGRLHYDYIAFVGYHGLDISAAYGGARNRCELTPHGVAVFIGAGGPMGQMHLQCAIELPDGPRVLIATEVNPERLEALKQAFSQLAKKHQRELHVINPLACDQSLETLVAQVSGQRGADDVIVSVPHAGLMEQGAALMNKNGMLVLFAGVPNGTCAPADLSKVYLSNAQYTGTSGLTLDDQRLVLDRAAAGNLSPQRSIAAIGGMDAALEAMYALQNGTYPGKIIIFPQLKNLPLMALTELPDKIPQVAQKLTEDLTWTTDAEEVLYELYWDLS